MSVLTVALGDDDADENFYWVSESILESLIQMGRLALWRAAWLIPNEEYMKLHAALDRVVQAKDITKGFNVAGVTYFVREVTPEEIVNLNKIELPSKP